MADSNTFSTVGAMRLLVVRNVVRAAPACCPRIRSTTSRAFCAEIRMYRASALASMSLSLSRLRALFGRRRRRFHRVPFELPGRGELAQLMPHHVFRDIHLNELLAVMHRDGMANELRQNRRTPRPGLHDLFLVSVVQDVDLLFQMTVGKRPFLNGTAHGLSLLRFPVHDPFIRALVVARLESACRLSPRGDRMPAAGGLALAAAVRM